MAIVNVERTGDGGFVARNDRGAEVRMGGSGDAGVFSPVELLLAAVGGCNIVTVEPLTAQRGHRLVRLAMTVEAEKVAPTRLGSVTITYDVELPEGDPEADEVFRSVAKRVEANHCTVSRALRENVEVNLVLPG
ncbi:OsmC family peroxiredoxin [Spongiactinospora rosea]|uniref:OsmC family peroxiredoxin n=1 Tax=Spongiactinospora rosea TaxID=2248750 RepID=A0A366LUV6_9ACTN|nr:OsmC family protein [Spongiactinospora rosea]RBQ17333.1 OsmC family peroxiredoxin [Spongiactinospora rosea]